MRRIFAAALAVAMLAAVAAADPLVSGETKVKAGKLLELSVPLAPGETALWDVYPPEKVDYRTYTTAPTKDAAGKVVLGKSTLNGTALAGDAYVKVTVFRVDGGAVVAGSKMLPVSFGGQKAAPPDGDKVKPKPEPKPKPNPEPGPEAVQLVFAVVEDGSQRTPDAARVLGDTKFWQGLKARGHLYFHYKTTSPEVAGLGYLEEMKTAGVSAPALLIMAPTPGGDTATIRLCEPLPKSVADVETKGKRFSTK